MLGSEHSDPCKSADNAGPYLISIAGSAGAFHPLRQLLAGWSADCPAAIAVAFHTGTGSVLVETLAQCSRLPIAWASSGAVLRPAHVYVAPPGTHLIVNPDGRLTLSEAPPIRWFRPSADWLFESAAASFRDRHVAIVLSGMLSDGASGIRSVKRSGGSVLVQDPRTCRYDSMPKNAISTRHVDAVLPVDTIVRAVSQIFARRQPEHDIAGWENPFVQPAGNG